MSLIPNNTFTMDAQGNLVPVGEVTGTVADYANKPAGKAAGTAAGTGRNEPAWKTNDYAQQGGIDPVYATDGNGNKTNKGVGTVTPGDNTEIPATEVTGTERRAVQTGQPAWKNNGYAGGPAGDAAGTGAPANADGTVAGGHYEGVYQPQPSTDVSGNGGGETGGGEVVNNPETQEVKTSTEPSFWDNGFTDDAVKKSGLSYGEAINNYNGWAKERGKAPLDFMTVWDMANRKDMTKTAAENEKEERKAKNQEKFERVGNFLSHLGNLIGTMYGAPSQQLESGVELTKRQQALKDRTLALRRQQGADYLTIYKQKKADELAAKNAELALRREDRLDTKAKLDAAKNEAFINYQKAREAKMVEETAYWKAKHEALEAGQPYEVALKQAQTAAANARAAASNAQAEKAKAEAGGNTQETSKEVINNITGKKETVRSTVTTRPAGKNQQTAGKNQQTTTTSSGKKVKTKTQL